MHGCETLRNFLKSKKYKVLKKDYDKKGDQHASNLDEVQTEKTGELKHTKLQLEHAFVKQAKATQTVLQIKQKVQHCRKGSLTTIEQEKEVKELRERIRQSDRETELNETFLEESREEIRSRDNIIRGLRKKLKSKTDN